MYKARKPLFYYHLLHTNAKIVVYMDRAAIISKQIAAFLKPGQKVLDVGAGNGFVAKVLQESASIQITLIDRVDYNKTNLPHLVYDGQHLPFADESFDYSLLIFVLHHTADPLPLLRESLRVARRGVIVVENHVQGFLRQGITRIIDSIPHFRYNVPVCYRAQKINDWLEYFSQLDVSSELLARFKYGFFWDNFVVLLSKT